jgi:squalene-hopene/tetraprenyl-beta-curcumene cyclase
LPLAERFGPRVKYRSAVRRTGKEATVTPVTRSRRRAAASSAFHDDVRASLDRGRHGLLQRQQPDGHWVGELEGDTILESEYILLLAFLGRETDSRIPKLANYLRGKQESDGGWPNYPGGPSDVSVSVKAYFALKIAGDDANAPHMLRAAKIILSLGGAAAANSFSRFYLALLGQIPWANCPCVPAEMMFLPRWFPFNIYALSAWSRTIVVPLAVVNAFKPVRPATETQSIRELFLEDPAEPWKPAVAPKTISWANFFLKCDSLFKFLERIRFTPLRHWAVRKAVAWMRHRCADSDGLGAIFPPMIYTAIVLRCLGVTDDAPEFRAAMRHFDELMISEDDTLRLQPCLSPVWDTALAAIGATDAGQPADSMETAAAMEWLLAKEVRTSGDWAKAVRGVEPGGWFFEYRNAHYPDVDDTAMVLIALARTGRRHHPAARRAIRWLLALQNRDEGWAAFDRDIYNEVLTQVPFADHNAMLDPSCPDITARVLEALSHYGYSTKDDFVQKAIAFILNRQEENGSWFGRWGVNYIYGTWQVLVGLVAIGFDMTIPPIRRAAHWLNDIQNADGGWGETCASYDDPSQAGIGPSTASQTAWALLGLLAAGECRSSSVQTGIEYLLSTQSDDGSWPEDAFTGTGFPKVFYLRYHMYPVYFPLMALGRHIKNN